MEADRREKPRVWPTNRANLRRLGMVALALLVGLIAWLATREGDSAGDAAAGAGFEPRIVSEAELANLADASGHAVYWAGPMPGKALEASEDEGGNFQVRYLGPGEAPGSNPTGAVVVGSYPMADAAAAVAGLAESEGAIARKGSDGADLVSNVATPSSVYFASPDGKVQVEVYAPSPKRAMSLAGSGGVEPVG